MFDRLGIYSRFISCFPDKTSVALAERLGIGSSAVIQWKAGKRQVSWKWLKMVADEQAVSWDWLLEGREPKYSQRKRRRHKPFDRHGINKRFLSLFPSEISQEKLGKNLGINGTTVFKWRHDMSQVPWERLKFAVENKSVTWEFLLEG